MMKANPILEEIWRVKDALAREAGYDVHRFFEELRCWSEANPHRGRVVRDAEDLRRLAAEHERERSEMSAPVLNDGDKPTP
jgi:hypothetical protein